MADKRASVRDRIREVQELCPNQLMVKTNVLVTKDTSGENERFLQAGLFKAIGVECREGEHLYRAHRDPKIYDPLPATKQLYAKEEVILRPERLTVLNC